MGVDVKTLIPFEKLLEKAGPSKYKLVILAARRALELSEGHPRLIEADSKTKPSIVALREIAEGKVTYKVRKQPKEKS
jgi:DNA-directed RNA polymerase omega subunit